MKLCSAVCKTRRFSFSYLVLATKDEALGTGLPAQAPHVFAPETQQHGAEGGHSPINTGLPLAPYSYLLMQTSQFFRKPTPKRL